MSYRQEHPDSPFLTATAPIGNSPPAADGLAMPAPRLVTRSPKRRRALPSAVTLIAVSIAVHLLAAALLYSRLVRMLYSLLEDTPRLVVLERGLVRILAASVFMPPFAPTVLLIAIAIWVGASRREPQVARAFAYGAIALALDTVLRLVGVSLAAPPANVGELLDLPARFSPGPRMFAELVGHPVSGGTFVYWSVVCSLAASVVVFWASRALLGAEEAAMEPALRRRMRARGRAIATFQSVAVSATTFGVIAFVGQLALPVATQLFLTTFG